EDQTEDVQGDAAADVHGGVRGAKVGMKWSSAVRKAWAGRWRDPVMDHWQRRQAEDSRVRSRRHHVPARRPSPGQWSTPPCRGVHRGQKAASRMSRSLYGRWNASARMALVTLPLYRYMPWRTPRSMRISSAKPPASPISRSMGLKMLLNAVLAVRGTRLAMLGTQ